MRDTAGRTGHRKPWQRREGIPLDGRQADSRPIDPDEVAATLAGGAGGAERTRRTWVRLGVAAALIVAAVIVFVLIRGGETPVAWETVTVTRGDLVVGVTATGTLAPSDTVSVGTEVSGVVDRVTVDYNDRVQRGQTLAVVNTDQLRAQILQQQASLEAAEAGERQAAATLEEARLHADRVRTLFDEAVATRQELESAQAALQRAEASLASARAQVAAARASLQNQQTALGKATIRSPIDGIVLQRQVEPGRTVTAAFQTPTLFVLAADLTRMTLALDIDEADVGQVEAGQTAEFTVDAYPDRVFTALVRLVRNAARTVDGVVTYPAILDVENEDLVLRPGMTATATIRTAAVHDVLLVPNAALRFTPDALPEGVAAAPAGPRVWTPGTPDPLPLRVVTGLSDGQRTEIREGEIAEGTPVIVGTADRGGTAARSTGPPAGMGGLVPGGGRVR